MELSNCITTQTNEELELEAVFEHLDPEQVMDWWIDKYAPIPNPSDTAEGWSEYIESEDREVHYGYTTYGKDLEVVKTRFKEHPGTVWTLVDSAYDSNMYIIPGMMLVNRVCYFITEHPVTEEDESKELLYHRDESSE